MIVITAPTGHIGRHLLTLLLAPAVEEPVRVVVRDPGRLPAAVRDRVEVVTGSHGDRSVLDRALDGADAVFWLVPPDGSRTPEDAYLGFTRPAVEAFAAHGTGHVVGVSALGRGTPLADRAGLVTASLAMDDLIAGSGVHYRALACPSFYDNLLEDIPSIVGRGVFTDSVAPGLPAPLVATADIAAAAARLLLDRSWTGTGSLPVVGPELLSPEDRARILTEQLGRPVRYEQQPYGELEAELLGYGLEPRFARGVVEMKRAKDAGLDGGVTPDPTATGFARWCTETLAPAVLEAS
ncbi:NAD(P)H-binding protein [Kitasatospora sp. NPDC096147]|uniref:NAD(P)H-binding protein n=1 Tax=Kitasatospora sp. NPDC096147 TaxID=3364093 RepID=UPI003819E45C